MKVFISHKSSDARWAKKIGTDLRARGIDAWLDIWNMPPGVPLTDAMERGIRESDAMLLLLSRSSVRSIKAGRGGLAFEVHIGEERRFSERNFRLIGILIEPCTPPLKLRNRLGRWLDFTDEKQYELRIDELANWIKGSPIGPPVTRQTYDLVSPSVEWLRERLGERDWMIPLTNLRSEGKNIDTLLYEKFPKQMLGDERLLFPWGPTLSIRPDIVGATKLENSPYYGWIIGICHTTKMSEHDVVRSHYYIQATDAFDGYVFWDMRGGFTHDGFTALKTLGIPYVGINERGERESKFIHYIMYVKEENTFVDDLEASFLRRMVRLAHH